MTRFGFLSTYPPTRCGLATFTEALADALVGPRDQAVVVRSVEADEPFPEADGRLPVSAHLVAGDRDGVQAAVQALDRCDVAIVQHEYGIYGGQDGEEVLGVLQRLSAPVVTVLHTVLTAPTPHQWEVLNRLCSLADVVVVMTENARERLLRGYAVDASRVRVIPHGAAVAGAHPSHRDSSRRRILTWGLIAPGKGIEWGIRAVGLLRDLRPPLEYVVAGQTHPKVRARSGETYRESLQALIAELGLEDRVTLDGRYLDTAQLQTLLDSADVVLLAYDSVEQATSGVLSEAVAAAVPVVATRFPHAVELLGEGSGALAHQKDPESMARALRTVLTGGAAGGSAPRHHLRPTWATVAEAYRELAHDLAAARAA